MSGQQALTLVGQVVGGVIGADLPIGSAVGAAVGGVVGSVIGGALFNEEIVNEGPRLTDLKQQSSSYGHVIPIMYGTCRAAGNVIWCTDIREVVHEEEVPGKGGSQAVVNRKYTYEMDVAIAICEGPVTMLERIIANGVTIYDRRFGTTAQNIFASGLWLTNITLYPGDEDQEPCSLMETALGIGNVPAYRGVAYVVIEALQLTVLRTQVMPNFEFVMVVNGNVQQWLRKIAVQPTYFQYDTLLGMTGTPLAGKPRVLFNKGVIRISGISTLGVETYDLKGNYLGLDERSIFETDMPSQIISESKSIASHVCGINHTITLTAPFTNRVGGWVGITAGSGTAAGYLASDNWLIIAQSGNTLTLDVNTFGQTMGGGVAYIFHIPFWMMWDGKKAYVNWSLGIVPRDLQIDYTPSARDVVGFLESSSPTMNFLTFHQCAGGHYIIATYCPKTAPSQYATNWVRFEWTGEELVIDAEGPVELHSLSGLAQIGSTFSGTGPTAFIHYGSSFAESDLRTLWNAYGAGNGDVQVWHIDDDNAMRAKRDMAVQPSNPSLPLFDYMDGFTSTSIYADEGCAFIAGDEALLIYSRQPEIEAIGVPLSQIVSALCLRAGLSAGDINVTALTELVEGFCLGTTMSARTAIESLRPGFFFDAVDGDKLKFVMRGGTPVAAFPYADLGAGQDDAQQTAVRAEFAQETELPARVNIKYISKSADYQQAAQSARRETTRSQEILDAEIPVVFTDVRAQHAADVNMRDKWAGSAVRTFATGVKYSKYEPTDVITVDDGDFVRQVRVTRRTDRGAIIEWEAQDEDALMYASLTSPGIDFSVVVPGQSPLFVGPTKVALLDLPPLTELPVGNESAEYVAAKGYTSGWAGAVVEISRDGGNIFTAGTVVTAASVMGTTTTALPNFLGGNVFDQSSRVRVDLGSGMLSSSTHDLVLDGANAAVIGDEIIQFRSADLVSSGVYDLYGLLRGRKGTEWAISTHTAFERFVLLTTNLKNLPLQISDRVAVDLLVRASSTGSTLAAPNSERFSTQLARLMPYSPAHLWATRDGDADWYLQWLRRDRYMNDWNDGTDVPMSEVAELYDVEVMSGATVLQTYANITSEYQTVPASVLGFSPTPPSIKFRVYQRSALVGRGFMAETTVTQT